MLELKLGLLGRCAAASVLAWGTFATPAAADGTIIIENRSAFALKAVAPGGSAVIVAGAPPATVSFTSAEPVGVMLQLWWVPRPLELCRIFTPWNRTVTVTGTDSIHCLSSE